MKIFIANVSPHTTRLNLHNLFSRHGDVLSAEISLDTQTGRSRGFGFVEMSEEHGAAAIDALNGAELDGLALAVTRSVVAAAAPGRAFRDDRGQTGTGGRGGW